MATAIVRSALSRAAIGAAPRTFVAPNRRFSSSAGHDDAYEAAKWEKITYLGIASCTALAAYVLSKGHHHGEDPPEISIPGDILNGSFKELCDYISLELVKFIGMNAGEETEDVKNLGFTLTRYVEQTGAGSISAIQRKSLANEDDDTVLKEFVNDMNESLE